MSARPPAPAAAQTSAAAAPPPLDSDSSRQPSEQSIRKAAPQSRAALEPDDFYIEGPYTVFTAAYHLKRGYCCNSNCRHCPYRNPT
ncbi:MAG TPA: DUF5522 domain-containing protein [Acidobacteriaceae bacterium]|nr:DUF5522 domain-containing protein [Acidobacteriaceae bacterium]